MALKLCLAIMVLSFPQAIFRLDVFQRKGLVLREVCAAIAGGLYPLCRQCVYEQKHHRNQTQHDALYFYNSSFCEILTNGPRRSAPGLHSGRRSFLSFARCLSFLPNLTICVGKNFADVCADFVVILGVVHENRGNLLSEWTFGGPFLLLVRKQRFLGWPLVASASTRDDPGFRFHSF